VRKRRSAAQREAIAAAHNWTCCLCGHQIDPVRDDWHLDHEIPLADGGEDTVENIKPVHARCHRSKTAADVARIAKGKRIRAKHIGSKTPSPRPLPGSKRSRWAKRYDRETGRWVTVQR
jgi:5-methylcytosine-specific restriction protein A